MLTDDMPELPEFLDCKRPEVREARAKARANWGPPKPVVDAGDGRYCYFGNETVPDLDRERE